MRMPLKISSHLVRASFLATILVVMAHVDDEMNPTKRTWVESFLGGEFSAANVSNFFFISGYLIAHSFDDKKWWVCAIAKRVRSLLVPYVLWNIIYVSIYLIASPTFELPHRNVDEIWHSVIRIFGIGTTTAPIDFPLWYLKNLFLFVLISPLVKLTATRGLKVVLITLAIIYALQIFITLNFPCLISFSRYGFNLIGFGAFVVGAFLSVHPCAMPIWLSKTTVIPPLLTWIIMSVFCKLCHGTIRAIVDPLNIALSIFCLHWLILNWQRRVPDILIQANFFIYAMHMLLLQVILRNPIIGIPGILQYITAVAWVIVTAALSHWMIIQVAPCLATLLTGGRSLRKYT